MNTWTWANVGVIIGVSTLVDVEITWRVMTLVVVVGIASDMLKTVIDNE
jgi:hypothetical protein